MNENRKDIKRIAIFASGNGSNCENLIQFFKQSAVGRVVLVVSNREDAYVLTRAKRCNVPTVVLSKSDFQDETKLCSLLESYSVDYIILAGFLLMIPSYLIKRYEQRIINIHPSLLPRHGGKGMYGIHVHNAVKEAGEKVTGITVHYVNEVCDGGSIIAQYDTNVSPNDSVQDIADKVHELEMRYFPVVIENVLKGK